MTLRKAICYSLALILVALVSNSSATHIRTIEIQVNRDACTSLTVEIILIAYVDYSNTNVQIGGPGSILRFGDGNAVEVPETPHEIIDPDLHVGRVQIKIYHTYSAFGRYTISFTEANRNLGTLNFDLPGNTPYYSETSILLEPEICNASALLLVPPIDRACTGIAYFHNPAATDREDDSLSYELIIPMKGSDTPVSNYLSPENANFYVGLLYNQANEEKNGTPTFILDAVTGTITWNAPGSPGEYAIAIKIKEWKYDRVNSVWYEAGYVIRDMQIIVEECTNQRPALNVPDDICVIAGSVVQIDIPASDADNDDVVIEAFSDIFRPGYQATVNPENGVRQSTAPPHDTASVRFSWQTSCAHVKLPSYKLIFKISDRPPSGPRLVRFYTVNINVIAPPPEYESVEINPVTKTVTLKWKDYPCENIETFQIWRRVSEVAFDQTQCNVGMPYFLRYQLMAEVPGTTSTYIDTDLAIGAQYCYRIVALIGASKVPGQLSVDTCFIPKPAEAPVIVNVSVQKTGIEDGEILIRWTRPFDIDQQQYPPPYQYKVFRKAEDDTQSVFQPITTQAISDTVFNDVGINTQQNIYHYRIELYVPALTTAPVDSSSEASTVFLTAHPAVDAIGLTWKAETPWYNYSQRYPYHYIYRGISPEGPFALIDSVNVNVNNFVYRDTGRYKGLDLNRDLYYYRILTHGTYGNAQVISPLENLSQVTAGQILDTIPPCQPVLSVAKINCSEFSCDGSDYYTRLEWESSDATCEDDEAAYELFVKEEGSEVYVFLGSLTGKTFIHSNLTSLNKCYRLISIDRSGNKSDSSDVVCNSNCAVFKLPNVITPGVKDALNDFLTTYPDEDEFIQDCSRSVKRVDIRIYSRWGEEIFTNTLTDFESRVFWNGLNKQNVEVSAGTYYYHAEVIFDTNAPSNRHEQIKGWIHVVR